MSSNEKLMLIDGNSLLYRAFFALPLLHTREGIYTNAVYGFLTMLKRAIAEEKPSHILVAFDKEKKTFRNTIYGDYKANRSSAPDELSGQFALVRELLLAINISYLEVAGYEADDIIGTLSKLAEEAGLNIIIVTGDGDALQLVSDKVKVLMNKKGISETQFYDIPQVIEKWELKPEKLIEVKALMGDASDNIPGVPGVGPKTAIRLIKEFESLENLYSQLDKVKGNKLVENLEANKDKAFLSRELATIIRDINLQCDLEDYRVKEYNSDELLKLYQKLEFHSLIKKLQEERELKAIDNKVTSERVEAQIWTSCEEVEDFYKSLSSDSKIAVYTETSYHHPMWAELINVYIEHDKKVYCLAIDSIDKLEWLRAILEDDEKPKYMHNAKYAQVLLKRFGIKLSNVYADTMLLSYLLNTAYPAEDLATLILEILAEIVESNPASLLAKVRELADICLEKLSPEIRALYFDLELPLADILVEMEYTGVKLDPDNLERIAEELRGRIKRDELIIHELAGCEFNINSPKQLGKVLFEDLGLRVIKKGKTGYSTGSEILEQLYNEHEIIATIMDYRVLTKLNSTYAEPLKGLIHPETDRVHTIFKQALTATGRLSSVEPNLQNIPMKVEEGRRIRKAFVAQDDEWVLLTADYSQIDLRVLAHISEDEILIETFKEGIDIHSRTASEIFQIPLSEVNSDYRQRAKAVNFGIIYGISDFGLARDTGVSRKEAKKYIEEYLGSYPGVKQYMEDIVQFGKKHGYVETILKRRRYLPDLNAKNKMHQALAERMALNTPIQGSSADIIKLAMIMVNKEIKSRKLNSKILIQVHDDLLLEVKKSELEEVAMIVKSSMEKAYDLKVPLVTSLKTGKNWYEMEKWEES